MNFTERLTEGLAVVGKIDPDENGSGSLSTDEIDMSKWRRVMFVVMAGTMGTNGTINFAVHEAAAAGGSYSAMTDKAITQLTQAGNDSDKVALVEVAAEELSDGKTHIKGVLTVGTAACDSAVVALAGGARYAPANDNDLAAVDEIVA